MRKNPKNKPDIPVLLLMLALTALALAMIFSPQLAYASALRGLELWWELVTPALLPFFFISELLLELDISRWLRYAMQGLMRPLFALPGSASLPVALGFCSGFPSGAAITAALRRRGEISREEGERLICFTNNAGPLYISVAIAGGLLGCPKAALILAIAHYGSNLLIGIGLGMRARLKGQLPPAASRLPRERVEPPRPAAVQPGRVLKTAAARAAANITSIGCLMIFFAVLNGFFTLIPIGPRPLLSGFIQGFWEMSLGVNALADSGMALERIIPATAAILGFGGVSVQTQVLAMIGDTDIRPGLYLLCRLLHAVLSYALAAWLCAGMSLPAAAIATPPFTGSILLFSLSAALLALGILFSLSLLSLILTPLLRRDRPPRHKN